VSPINEEVSADIIESAAIDGGSVQKHVLIVDDSAIARKQIQKVVESLGVKTTTLKNGQEAVDFLNQILEDGKDPIKELLMIISDIEMPEMDGYTFTAEVRSDPRLADMHIVLHTSLSGVFNEAMVKKVGANDFLAKFHPDELASASIYRPRIYRTRYWSTRKKGFTINYRSQGACRINACVPILKKSLITIGL